MKIAMLSPITWRTPPKHYCPLKQIVSLLTENLVKRGIDVTLFATGDSITSGTLHAVAPAGYAENKTLDPKVWECLHISELFEQGEEFDIIHNHFDFLPLTYTSMTTTPVVTTIHGFSSPSILPVYEKYNGKVFYVAISETDKSQDLDYAATIHHGINLDNFTFRPNPDEYLLFLGRIHPDKGTGEAVKIAQRAGKKLIIAGVIQDQLYFEREVKPHIDNICIVYAGSAGPEKRDELLGGAYALLHPINFKEPFGLSIVESMACGTPVIAFNRGSMPELIGDRITGFLVTDIQEAVDAVAKISTIDRRQCRKRVEEHFTAQRMTEDYIDLYNRILEKTKREDHRPWGYYQVLSDNPDHKVKRIMVYPGKRLSLQRHRKRDEHWHIISGEAVVTCEEQKIQLKKGQSIDIPRGSAHRIFNPGTENMVFIEVQTGDYFGEDDIERIEDDYGRT